MPTNRPAPSHRLRHCAAALALAAASTLAAAAPDETDPLARLIAEKGLTVEAATGAASAPLVAAAPVAGAAPIAPPGLLGSMQARAADLVVGAMNSLGVRYRRGGSSAETGFDCSGFTKYVFENSWGLVLPRRADEQAGSPNLVPVARADLKPGDLVFFNTLRRTFSHVGIYIGDNRFIHAPSSGKDVRTEDMNFAYWAKRFTGARRFEGPAKGE